jgi:hypothetical protein
MLIQNLVNDSNWHRQHCQESCNVSLFQLKQAAEFIMRYMKIMGSKELNEAQKLIDSMGIV